MKRFAISVASVIMNFSFLDKKNHQKLSVINSSKLTRLFNKKLTRTVTSIVIFIIHYILFQIATYTFYTA